MQKAIEDLQEEYKKLVYAVSHDLQSPIRVMDGHIHMLTAKIGADENLTLHTDALQESLSQMKSYLLGLIDYSRTIHTTVNPQEFSMSDLLELVKYELRTIIEKSDAKIELITDGSSFFGDKELMKKLLAHLLDNAIKFQPTGQAPVIQVRVSQTASTSTLSIQDNGIGFDPKWTDRTMELFQRLHSTKDYPGNGLGLAICKKIVDMHKGEISFHTDTGAGCLVKVVINR